MVGFYSERKSIQLRKLSNKDERGEWHFFYTKTIIRGQLEENARMSIQALIYDGKSWIEPTRQEVRNKIYQLGYDYSKTKVWQRAYNYSVNFINNEK